jgi:succinate-acetate transporter protein
MADTTNGQGAYKDEATVANPAAPHHLTYVSQVPNPPYNKLANPGPLGLIGFALTTFVLGLYQCGAG